jgi:ABC-2 type transport system permease protein
LAVVYAVYLCGFLFFTLAVSARCASSKTALLICLAFWALAVLAAPRFLMDTAKTLYPTDPALELKHSLDARLAAAAAEAWEQREAALLKQYRVTKKEDLPIAFEGIELQVDEEVKYPLFEDHYGAFFDKLRQQNRFYQFGTLIAPITGLQLASMALAGNDLEQHRDFILQGEANRRVIHTMINDFMVKHSVRNAEGDWEIEAGRELWQRIPPFEYRPPAWRTVLAHYGLGLGLLVLWAMLSVAYALFAVHRLWNRGAQA